MSASIELLQSPPEIKPKPKEEENNLDQLALRLFNQALDRIRPVIEELLKKTEGKQIYPELTVKDDDARNYVRTTRQLLQETNERLLGAFSEVLLPEDSNLPPLDRELRALIEADALIFFPLSLLLLILNDIAFPPPIQEEKTSPLEIALHRSRHIFASDKHPKPSEYQARKDQRVPWLYYLSPETNEMCDPQLLNQIFTLLSALYHGEPTILPGLPEETKNAFSQCSVIIIDHSKICSFAQRGGVILLKFTPSDYSGDWELLAKELVSSLVHELTHIQDWTRYGYPPGLCSPTLMELRAFLAQCLWEIKTDKTNNSPPNSLPHLIPYLRILQGENNTRPHLKRVLTTSITGIIFHRPPLLPKEDKEKILDIILNSNTG